VREDADPWLPAAIKAALAIRLKKRWRRPNARARARAAADSLCRLRSIPGVHLLADQVEDRLAILSFYVEDMHYNLVVKLSQRPVWRAGPCGCSCAGTYGHYLLHVDPTRSHAITAKIDEGDLSDHSRDGADVGAPDHDDRRSARSRGRGSCRGHPRQHLERDYVYSPKTNEFQHIHAPADGPDIRQCFDLRLDALVSRR